MAENLAFRFTDALVPPADTGEVEKGKIWNTAAFLPPVAIDQRDQHEQQGAPDPTQRLH
ncbi:MAG TPA: hypothetical protein PKD53_10000 [Chloroflexaceae bacterium]|nr:hypothetical protein [Chloroflexaceae bacterium]